MPVGIISIITGRPHIAAPIRAAVLRNFITICSTSRSSFTLPGSYASCALLLLLLLLLLLAWSALAAAAVGERLLCLCQLGWQLRAAQQLHFVGAQRLHACTPAAAAAAAL
jgi:hypothetical protein